MSTSTTPGSETAFPCPAQSDTCPGLSKREWLVGQILPGVINVSLWEDIVAGGIDFGSTTVQMEISKMSALAIAIADETLKQLEGGK